MGKTLKEHFLSEVLQQIRSKEAKEFVQKELSFHMQKSKEELLARGLSEEEAEEKSIMQMGNPAELGEQFNKLHRPKIDWLLLGLFALAFGLGFLPLFGIQEVNLNNLLAKQAIYIVIGTTLALVMMFVDYRKLEKWSWLFLGLGIMILLVLRYFTNYMINGVPYLPVLGFKIDSITALPFLFLFWAAYFSKKNPNVWLMIFIYLLTAFLILSLPALSVMMMYSVLLFVQFWCSTFNRRAVYLTTGVGASLVIAYSLLFWFGSEPYQKSRLLGFLHPETDPNGAGWLYIRIKEMMTGAGWFGNSATPNNLPGMSTDLAFVNVTYFYGWLVGGILVLILSLIAIRMIFISSKISNRFGRQLVIGAIALFSIQFIYNIGMTLGVLPIISLSLPFISYGLTPAILNSLIIGTALSVYRRKQWDGSSVS